MYLKSLLLIPLLAIPVVAPLCAYAAPKGETASAPQASQESEGDPRSIELNEKGVAAVKARNLKQAEDFFRRSLATDTKNLTAVVNLAAIYMTLRRVPEAISLLEEYSSKYQQDPALYARLGDAYFAGKKIRESVSAYEKALVLDPHFPNVASRLGTVYALTNRLHDAERMFLQAVEENPRDAQTLASLSSLFLGNGKPQLAVSTAKRALQVKPTKEVYVTLGSAYELLKDFKNSLIAFQRAQDLGESSAEVKEKVTALERLSAS